MSVFIIFDIQVRIISRLRAIIITSLSIKKVKSKQRAHSCIYSASNTPSRFRKSLLLPTCI
jgi:hypothetical protein